MKAPFILTLVMAGCSTALSTEIPELRASDLELRIRTQGPEIDDSFAIYYELLNHSPVAVCTGTESIFLADRKIATRIVTDALCSWQGKVVSPGEARTWSEAWSVAGCFREAPGGFAKAFSELMCGASVPLRLETVAFRVVDGVEHFGGTPLVSNSVVVTRISGASSLPSNRVGGGFSPSPPTPPGMRVRTGRLTADEQTRSGGP
jgi:hypothetical protein